MIDFKPVRVGDTLVIVASNRAIKVRAVTLNGPPREDPNQVSWENVDDAEESGVVPYETWQRATAAQEVMLRSGMLGEGKGDEDSVDLAKLIDALKTIGSCCRTVGQLESIQNMFSTKIIGNAARDMRRIQQLVYTTIGTVFPEEPH